MRWRLKSPASRLFTQPFIQAQIKENIKALRHWPLCRKFTVERGSPHTNGQQRGKCSHLMTSSWKRNDLDHISHSRRSLIFKTVSHNKYSFAMLLLYTINSPYPSDVIWCQTFLSVLVRVMARRLVVAKPLPKPMVTYHQLDAKNKYQWHFTNLQNIYCMKLYCVICPWVGQDAPCSSKMGPETGLFRLFFRQWTPPSVINSASMKTILTVWTTNIV